jgi:hypothetical protein
LVAAAKACHSGVAALVCAIIAIAIPFGIINSAIGIVLAVVAALADDRVFATANAIIAFVNTRFLSPTTWILLGSDTSVSHFLRSPSPWDARFHL